MFYVKTKYPKSSGEMNTSILYNQRATLVRCGYVLHAYLPILHIKKVYVYIYKTLSYINTFYNVFIQSFNFYTAFQHQCVVLLMIKSVNLLCMRKSRTCTVKHIKVTNYITKTTQFNYTNNIKYSIFPPPFSCDYKIISTVIRLL